ncbi:MAG: OmpA family protein [Muribaculaceae bacterium]
MKKIALIVALCAIMVPSIKAQEVTYVEDPSQGYLLNSFKDNWFIHGELGAGVLMSPNDKSVDKFSNRIGYSFNLSVGKWFSPVVGIRGGADAYLCKGAAKGLNNDLGLRPDLDYAEGNMIAQKSWQFGPTFDVLVNLTNWWCGYKPGRVYNGVFYVGAAVNFACARDLENGGWSFDYADSHSLSIRTGLLNKFAVSKRVDILLDLRCDLVQEHFDTECTRNLYATALVGVGYNFGKTEWKAPVTAICPTWKYTDAEGDALAARLQAAEAKIADLEKQLRDCLNRKPEVIEKDDAPLATIYYPIGKSTITGVNIKIVDAVAEVMKQSDKNYVLTGWADNYTGTDKINAKLRKDRVNGVKKALVRKGVAEGRLDAQINDGNLTNFGAKCASLDRAVTINEAK